MVMTTSSWDKVWFFFFFRHAHKLAAAILCHICSFEAFVKNFVLPYEGTCASRHKYAMFVSTGIVQILYIKGHKMFPNLITFKLVENLILLLEFQS
jgi:hypothetical protein